VAAADPIRELGIWIEEARESGAPHPASVAFVTVGGDGRPSVRTVTLSAWRTTRCCSARRSGPRKVAQIEANPEVALLFHWPSLGRQVQIAGVCHALAERALAEELFAERDLLHQLQTVVSRQGEPVEDQEPLRDRLAHLTRVQETTPACPPDWGALRVRPRSAEFWAEAPDRIHERRLFERDGAGWRTTLLAP
jgi:pyridoxamine 5'-phosphate oxidase